MDRFPKMLAFIFLILVWGWQVEGYGQLDQTSAQSLHVRFYSRLYTDDVKNIAPFLLTAIERADSLLEEQEADVALSLYKNVMLSRLLPPAYAPTMYIRMAMVYEQLHNYEQATLYNFKALEKIKDTLQSNELLWKAACYVNLGWLQREAGNYEQADYYCRMALTLYQYATPPYRGQINALLLQANIAKARGEHVHGNEVFRQTIDIIDTVMPHTSSREKQTLMDMLNRIYNNVADTYLYLHKPDSTLYWLSKTDKDFELLHPYVQGLIYITRAEAYNQKGKNFVAKEALYQALAHSLQYDYKNIVMICYKELALLYERSTHYREALHFQKEYISLKETIFSETGQNIQTINRLEAKYKEAKKDKELADKELLVTRIASREKERSLQAKLLYTSVIGLVLILIISIRNYRNKQKLLKEKLYHARKARKITQIEATLKGEENERERIAKELHDGVVGEAMALTLNLHTVGKAFPVLQSTDGYRNLVLQSETITSRLRETAHNLMPFNLQETGIIPSVKAFINRINSSSNIHFTLMHFGTLPKLDREVEKIILLSIIELIQNIMKHAIATEAIIQINYHDQILSITVEDNGIGISKNFKEGMGIRNLKNNMAILQATLDIQGSEHSGTTIFMEIPLGNPLL